MKRFLLNRFFFEIHLMDRKIVVILTSKTRDEIWVARHEERGGGRERKSARERSRHTYRTCPNNESSEIKYIYIRVRTRGPILRWGKAVIRHKLSQNFVSTAPTN